MIFGESSDSKNLSIAGMWGFIIPVLSWVSAHGVVVSVIECIRNIGAIVVDRITLERLNNQELVFRRVVRIRNRYLHLCGFALTGLAAYLVFRVVISFDRLLFQYQIIDTSILRKMLGGKGWSVNRSPEDIRSALEGSFLGLMALHAGDFYVISLFVTAFLLVVAIHRAWHIGENRNNIYTPQRYRAIEIILPTGSRPVYPPSLADNNNAGIPENIPEDGPDNNGPGITLEPPR